LHIISSVIPQWAKLPKKQSEGVRFFNLALKLYCQKYTPTDCFFRDFELMSPTMNFYR